MAKHCPSSQATAATGSYGKRWQRTSGLASRVSLFQRPIVVGLEQRWKRGLQQPFSCYVSTCDAEQYFSTSIFLRASQVERCYIARKAREQAWREIVIYRKEHAAAGLIQRWTRGVLVRRRTPLVRTKCRYYRTALVWAMLLLSSSLSASTTIQVQPRRETGEKKCIDNKERSDRSWVALRSINGKNRILQNNV